MNNPYDPLNHLSNEPNNEGVETASTEMPTSDPEKKAPTESPHTYAPPLYTQAPPTQTNRPPMSSYTQTPPQTPPPRRENGYTPSYEPYRYPSYAYAGNDPYRTSYRQPTPQPNAINEKKGASKGFVITFVCLGMIVSMLLGVLLSAALFLDKNGTTPLAPSGGNNVIIQYEPKGETPVITDKGNVAYVASLVADTVVEVTTETVSTDSYYGQYVTQGAGSGVIISSGDGGSYILTCAHVIEGSTKVTIKMKDGTEYEAVEIAADSQTDVGIIKLNVKGLPCATIGDYTRVQVGEEVIAIGNPLGELGGSVTNGVVSALDRDVIIDGTTYHLLQTNAEINPGNSGGGLFNAEGKLIGIVNAKSAGENVEGLGFAIPIDDAMTIASNLIENGYVAGRVQLGFQLFEIQSQADIQYWWQYRRYFTDYGIYLVSALDERFETGDHLVAIDSYPVNTLAELKALLLEFEVGQTVTVTISRLNERNRPELIDIELVLTEKTA